MRTNIILLTAALVIASVSVNAQSRNDKNSNRSSKQTTNTRKSSTESATSSRTITVQSQPAKALNQVSRSQVSYKKTTPKVVAVRTQNRSNMKTVKHNNKDFYYESGIYYRKYNDNYIKVAPPVGLSIQLLPQGSVRIAINNRNVFYFEGVFYQQSNNGYVVETPPVGAIVDALPADYERVELNGLLYYEYNGILYSRVRYDSDRAYQVVGYLE
ncbi:DUF6515 family protein [Mangrovibacterium lignilyticum]|uniref:DUF6515 family protein n=1 Tax=Mangrovibacterium lignilyticum TaxID=2668052 RepID=UPI0013D0E540|nr:DUF6515 family protein [Mangrovibacterium lignilyticum]